MMGADLCARLDEAPDGELATAARALVAAALGADDALAAPRGAPFETTLLREPPTPTTLSGALFSLRRDGAIRVAGYRIGDARRTLVLALGNGVEIYAPPPGETRLRREAAAWRMPIVDGGAEIAIDATERRRWPTALQAFIDDAIEAGEARLRWSGSVVAELHRLVLAGGALMLPALEDDSSATPSRPLIAEPAAFMVAAAGGAASDGAGPLLGGPALARADRAALYAGDPALIARAERCLAEPDAAARRAPLFGVRGLFRD